MENDMLYPIKMIPVFRDYLWGGKALAERYGKTTEMRPIAESWEISCYPGSSSVAANGVFKGKTLSGILKLHPEMMGGRGEFPLLVKLIDARDRLSLQVHPDDAYAKRVENGTGKNEMWYIVDCEPEAEIIAGFSQPVTGEELERRLCDNTVLEIARRIKVSPGDCYLIPAGLLHAIGAGIIVAEIQQNSDLTYRVYDYGRVGADGKPRALHVEKAADVIDTSLRCENVSGGKAESFGCYSMTRLASWKYFGASLLRVDGRAPLRGDADSFGCLLVTRGGLALKSGDIELDLCAGDSIFLPAGLGDYSLSGQGNALLAVC